MNAAANQAPAQRPLPRERAQHIADAFLPRHPLGSRYHYYYVRTKLRSDPLYPGVCAALAGTRAPLLDLGCGLGLLAHALRQEQIDMPYHGVDLDRRKIDAACHGADRAGLANVEFDTLDLAAALPAHRGSVAILDVLQYLGAERQAELLDTAIGMLEPGARLVIRAALDGGGGRTRITVATDRIAQWLGWMQATPRHYPAEAQLRAQLDAAGLRSRFSPLAGNTPFNHWLIVAERD